MLYKIRLKQIILILLLIVFIPPALSTSIEQMTADKAPLVLAESKFASLAEKLGLTNTKEPLPASKAFTYDLITPDNKNLIAIWKIVPGHYLYKDKIKFTIKSDHPEKILLGSIQHGKTKTKNDAFFGKIQIYDKDFEVRIPIKNPSDYVTIETEYQGCSEITGICYPPQKTTHTLAFSKVNLSTPITQQNPPVRSISASANTPTQSSQANTQAPTTQPIQSVVSDSDELPEAEDDIILNQLKGMSSLGAMLFILAIGIGLAFTPCIYPMIPILSSIIVGQGQGTTAGKAFWLSLAYVLPMAFIYGVAGYFIGIGGDNLQVAFQKPWVLISFAILFLLFALSMFGFFELQMPRSIQNKLTAISNNQQSGTYVGAAIMGALSALIVGPCVTGPLMAVFAYIAFIGDANWGALTLFVLGLGIGIPLLALGTSAGKLLPKAGAWMESTKAVFGVMMIGMAIWMLDRVLPTSAILFMTASLLIITGIYMGALSTPSTPHNKWSLLWKGLGLIGIIYGALMLIGLSMGSHRVIQPLVGINTPYNQATNTTSQAHLTFKAFSGLDELRAEIKRARAQGKPVMVDIYADWCTYCKTIEQVVFPDPNVKRILKNYVLLRTDITQYSDTDKALLKHYGLQAPPVLLFFSKTDNRTKQAKLLGNITAKELVDYATLFFKNYG